MASKLPYVAQPGSMVKIFEKVREAQTPERFTGDFLQTKLAFRGGNYMQFIPLAKKLGFLGTDGRPTAIYKSFRNAGTTKDAMAQALKIGYKEVFERNEHADALKRDDFKGLVVEITGLESKNRVVGLICSTFESLAKLADFSAVPSTEKHEERGEEDDTERDGASRDSSARRELDLNLSYTINLVLPKTDDPAVFTAIFKSLRENLLRK
jgi:Family of unknown function (DUF5343)